MDTARQDAFAALRRLARERAVAEQCDFCSAGLATEHRHILEVATRRLVCVCDPCALLFGSRKDAKYRGVPGRVARLADFRLTDELWNSLLIPIDLAFFYRSSSTARIVAFYPSPAGPTESLLELRCWDEIVADNPVLESMDSDVEALIVNRIGTARDYFIAPVDECFRLVGVIRTHWSGMSGGVAVWQEIGNFFENLRRRSAGGGAGA